MEIFEFIDVYIDDDALSTQAIWYLTIIDRVSSFIDTILVGIAANAMDFRDSRHQIMVAVVLFGLDQAAMRMVANKAVVDIVIDADMEDEMVVDRVVDKLVGKVVDNTANAEVEA